jgi:hypothetical protein
MIEVGFDEDDSERFMNRNLSPEQMLVAVDQLMQMKMIPPQIAEAMKGNIIKQAQAEQTGEGNQGAGRPITQNPVDVVRKATPGADSNQIQVQSAAAHKQTGRTKTGNY